MNKKIYLSSQNKVIAGVCGGIAEALEIDPIIIRIIMLTALFWGGLGAVLYLLAWVIIPVMPNSSEYTVPEGQTAEHNSNNNFPTYKKLYLSNHNRKLLGVCGGIGEYFNCDPTIIRIIFLLLFLFCGSGVLLYIIAYIVMPFPPNNK